MDMADGVEEFLNEDMKEFLNEEIPDEMIGVVQECFWKHVFFFFS